MKRASICVASDSEEEIAKFEEWTERWKLEMTVFSDNYGCGCCVNLFDVEGPDEAIDSIPSELRTNSKWSDGDEN